MKGAFVCTADKVLQQHQGECRECCADVTQILIETGALRKRRDWILAHYEPSTQTYVRHVCGEHPLKRAA